MKPHKITLEEILEKHITGLEPSQDIEVFKAIALKAMREAAEVHVKCALRAAYDHAYVVQRGFEYTEFINKKSIIESYKPRHIK